MRQWIAAAGLVVVAMAAAPTAAGDFTNFTSPSGNIGCIIDADYVRCDIAEWNWSPPPRPADCPGFTGYGQGIDLRPHGPASFVCAGDTTLGADSVLPYGQRATAGGLACWSGRSGVECANSDGRGFRLSRESYDLI